MLLGEPLDGAGNRRSGNGHRTGQVRDLAWTRPFAGGFASGACDAPLARFVTWASAAQARARTRAAPLDLAWKNAASGLMLGSIAAIGVGATPALSTTVVRADAQTSGAYIRIAAGGRLQRRFTS